MLLLAKPLAIALIVLAFISLQAVAIVLTVAWIEVRKSLMRRAEQPDPRTDQADYAADAQKYIKKGEAGGDWFSEHLPQMENLYMQSYDGLRLHAWYLPAEKAGKTVIICHGYTDELGKIAAYLPFFYDGSWNIVLIDQRAHGYSEGKYIGMGVPESQDLIDWTEQICKSKDAAHEILWLGWSMGGSTVLLASRYQNPSLKAIVADSAFTSVKDISFLRYSRYVNYFSTILAKMARRFIKRISHYDMRQGNCLAAVKSNRHPLLFIHGEADRLVPLQMGRDLYKAAPAADSFLVIPNAGHVRAVIEQAELVFPELQKFTQKYFS